MAPITCSDCHQQISDAAPACIHCGRPTSPPSTGVPPRPLRIAGDFSRAGALRRSQPAERSGLLRGVALTVVVLVLFLWIAFGEFSEGLESLLRGLGTLAVGVAVILSDEDKPAAPANRRARKSWGDHFAAQDRQQEFQWSLIVGGIFIALGIVNLVLAALDAAG
ncbi:MAG TPA: hypothetical protein VGB24_03210 [Longimicrobium sp.]|jgi:hypothetical protein|uniref:hypothetical protein n=1 Tax=Longimicrobium sp. TaxID=2029185 RepID=UPI002EDA725E